MITILQLIQFGLGAFWGGFCEIFWYYDCLTYGDWVSIIYHGTYLPILTLLFINFYIQTYIKKPRKIKDKQQ